MTSDKLKNKHPHREHTSTKKTDNMLSKQKQICPSKRWLRSLRARQMRLAKKFSKLLPVQNPTSLPGLLSKDVWIQHQVKSKRASHISIQGFGRVLPDVPTTSCSSQRLNHKIANLRVYLLRFGFTSLVCDQKDLSACRISIEFRSLKGDIGDAVGATVGKYVSL